MKLSMLLALFAFAFGAVAFAPAAQATPATPAECAGMTFDQTIILTEGNDSYVNFGSVRLLVFGLGGDDRIALGPSMGDSCVVTGDGLNRVSLRVGNNVVVGGSAQDIIAGGSGNDTIYGGDAPAATPDQVDGGAGFDTCTGLPNMVAICESVN